ncbi:hypothetical protein JYQ62_09625 [Nostoc sp. UHCC 0702]|nr:hypothetical protein JYQ62_09625 [Nostoc sp. UHCC 0702]
MTTGKDTSFSPEDYCLDSRGAGEQRSRGEKFVSVILQREGSRNYATTLLIVANTNSG